MFFEVDESDFDAFAEGAGDALEHGQRMAGVVGVLEPAHDRGGDGDALGEFALAKDKRAVSRGGLAYLRLMDRTNWSNLGLAARRVFLGPVVLKK